MIKVYAPATIANMGMGFDLLGAALEPVDGSLLGDVIEMEKTSSGIEIACDGPYSNKLPIASDENIVVQCAGFFAALPELNYKGGIRISLRKNLPVGSGLGSSASSVVAAFFALNEMFDRPFSRERLLEMMAEFEGRVSGSVHYDNIAPSFLGGLQLLVQGGGQISVSLPFFKEWFWVVAYPGTSLSTAKMRALLPAEYKRSTLIDYGRQLAAFVHASYGGDPEMAAAMIRDVVAEPYRSPHIPGYERARELMRQHKMLACSISGSGPTIFAVSNDLNKAEEAAKILNQQYVSEAGGFVKVCRISPTGTRIF